MIGPDSCPTVVIVGEKSAGNPQGVREINASDYNPEIHTLFEGVIEAAAPVVPRDANGLRTDGPTETEYRAAGYTSAYPPRDYAAKAEPVVETVAAKVEEQKPAGWGNAPTA